MCASPTAGAAVPDLLTFRVQAAAAAVHWRPQTIKKGGAKYIPLECGKKYVTV